MDSVSLDSYRVLDSPPEAHFDRITTAAARILGAPFAILSFLDGDGEWVKSAYGCAPGRVSGKESLGAQVIHNAETTVVTHADSSWRMTRLTGVPGLRLYAGTPLVAADGKAIGVLAVLDYKAGPFNEAARATLEDLAAWTIATLEVRRLEIERELGDRHYEQSLERAEMASLTHDLEGRIVAVSRSVENLTGFKRSVILSMSVADLLTPRGWDGVCQTVQEQLGGAIPAPRRVDLGTAKGVRVAAEMQSRLVFQAGKPVAVETTVRDLTRQRKTELALREVSLAVSAEAGEAFLRSLAINLTRALGVAHAWIADLIGPDCDLATTVASAFNGQTSQNVTFSLRDTPFETLGGNEPRTYPRGACRLFPNDAVLAERKIESYSGIPLADAEGNPIGLMVVLDTKPMENVDLVESTLRIYAARAALELRRRRDEKRLRASEELHSSVVESLHEGVALMQADGQYSTWNASAAQILGQTPPELEEAGGVTPALGWLDANGKPLPAAEHPLRRAISTRAPVAGFITGVRRAGEVVWLRMSAQPLFREGDSEPYAAACSFVDITRQRQTDEALRRFGANLRELHRLSSTVYADQHSMFADYLRTGCRLLGFSCGAVTRVHEGSCRVQSFHTDSDDLPSAFSGPLEETLCNEPWQTRRTVWYHDVSAHGPRIGSYAGTPLFAGTRPYGVLSFALHHASEPDFLSSEHKETLELLARGLGRVIAETEVEDSRSDKDRRFRSLIENAADMIAVVDRDDVLSYASPSLERALGYAANQLRGKCLIDYIHPDDCAGIRAALRAAGAKPGVHLGPEPRVRHADGSWRTVEFVLSNLFDDPAVRGMVITGRDVTERRRVEQRLKIVESAVANAGDAVVVTQWAEDAGARIYAYVNEAFSRITGFAASEIIGKKVSFPESPNTDADQLERVLSALERSEPVRAELAGLRKDGTEFWLELTGFPFSDSKGSAAQWIWVMRDTTERKRAEILEHDRAAVLEMVAGGTPLPAVLTRVAQLVEHQIPGANARITLEGEWETEGTAGVESSDPAESDQTAVFPILSGSGSSLGRVVAELPRRVAEADHELLRTASQLASIAIERTRLSDELEYQARHDSLTALPNRLQLADDLELALSQARGSSAQVVVCFVDMDRFKQVNDTLGHAVGDRLLMAISQRLRNSVGSGTIARFGGDEFAAMLTGVESQEQALSRIRGLLDSVREPFRIGGYELVLTATAGVSFFPKDGASAASLLRMADSAMYHAKKSGRDVACFSPQMRETAAARLELETSLWRAMQNGELAITFQPQVRLDGGIEGYEALLTWRHPRLGLISPSDFIPIAEQSGLIVPIGAWVLEEACRRCAAWQRDSSRPIQVAVNVSAVQLARSDFIDVVRSATANAGLEPARLELELTETLIMSSVEDLARCLSEIRQSGVRIAIDDFGTGYSSLSYLSRLPADTLKIDRSFLLEAESEQSAVLETIVKLAHNHGLRVVAEGVETKQQLSALVRAGCDLAQGYLFGLPTQNPEPHGEVAGV